MYVIALPNNNAVCHILVILFMHFNQGCIKFMVSSPFGKLFKRKD